MFLHISSKLYHRVNKLYERRVRWKSLIKIYQNVCNLGHCFVFQSFLLCLYKKFLLKTYKHTSEDTLPFVWDRSKVTPLGILPLCHDHHISYDTLLIFKNCLLITDDLVAKNQIRITFLYNQVKSKNIQLWAIVIKRYRETNSFQFLANQNYLLTLFKSLNCFLVSGKMVILINYYYGYKECLHNKADGTAS